MKYFQNGNLVSYWEDQTTKICFKEKKNKKFQCQLSINDSYPLFTLFLLEDKNILICIGKLGTKIYSLEDFKIIKFLDIKTNTNGNHIPKFDDDKIILGGNEIKYIFSLSKNDIVNKISDITFKCFSIHVIDDKGIFLLLEMMNSFEFLEMII